MRSTSLRTIGVLVVAGAVVAWLQIREPAPPPWTESEVAVLRSLWLESLPALPADRSNKVADDPRAAAFGQQLFFDPRMSANGQIACSTCHQPVRRFSDGLAKGQAIGTSKRNTPSIAGSAYSPWLYWDGRRDSQWSQALAPLEDPNEHGSNRMQVIRVISSDESYRGQYVSLFGPLTDLADVARFPIAAAPGLGDEWDAAWQAMAEPDRVAVNTVFSNIGKAIAAFERTILPVSSRFDDYVAAVIDADTERQQLLFNDAEVRGLRLFIGEANCTQCHNGPLLTNNEFHNTGVLSFSGEVPDKGRVGGLPEVFADPFNCLGDYSDDPERHCPELEFARTGAELVGAFRTPSLRNVEGTAPFMHKGQIATLGLVLEHYNEAPDAMIGHNEAKPLGLGKREIRDLASFLGTLTPREQAQFDSM